MATRILKELCTLRKNLTEMTGGQAKISDIKTDDATVIILQLTPASGYYKGDTLDFKLEFGEGYPAEPPAIICLSDIYHPNIDTSTYIDGNVCLNLLDSDFWCAGFGIQGCVFGLLFLLENPNFDDPISPYFQPRETLQEYIDDIKNYRKGKKVSFMDCLLDEVIESSSRVSVKTSGENTVTQTDKEMDDSFSDIETDDKETVMVEDLNADLIVKEHGVTVPTSSGVTPDDVGTVAPCSFTITCPGQAVEQNSDSELMIYCHTSDANRTKRQISEDNIVEASNKIFLKASGEKFEQKITRCVSIDERPDFEELMYTHFMYTETET